MYTIRVDASRFGVPLQQLAQLLGDPAPVLESIGLLLESNVRSRAELAVDPNGARWASWADSTREGYPWPGAQTKERIEQGPGHGRLLDRYGTMLGSPSYQVGADSVVVGFGQDYAVFHEWGTKTMPRRGLLMANPDAGTLGRSDEEAVLDVINRWLDDLMGGQ